MTRDARISANTGSRIVRAGGISSSAIYSQGMKGRFSQGSARMTVAVDSAVSGSVTSSRSAFRSEACAQGGWAQTELRFAWAALPRQCTSELHRGRE
jgi:hypothetical protein